MKNCYLNAVKTAFILIALLMLAAPVRAEIDGHGPDGWRVTGVSANDFLNARMGPGTNYPVIEKFAPNERAMQQITCVPFYTAAHFTAMSEAQIKALPPRWCLMRTKSMSKAGWVLQRFITPDNMVAVSQPSVGNKPVTTAPAELDLGEKVIQEAATLVRNLYAASARADKNQGPDPLRGASASKYFTSDIVNLLKSGEMDAHPLYGAQDFDGKIIRIAPEAEQLMIRGMVIINVDFTNFGQQQRAVFYLRGDTEKPGAPLRIFSVDHDGWSYP